MTKIKDLLIMARDYSRMLNYEKAKELLLTVISRNPFEYQALTEIRKNFVKNKKYVEGVKYFKSLLKKHPGNSHIRKHLGIIYGEMGNSPKAIKMLAKVINDHPDDITLMSELGLAYNRQGNIKGANTCLRKILSKSLKEEVFPNQEKMKRVETELIKASKLAAASAMASGFAHQINNPLFGIQLSVESLMDRIEDEKQNIDKSYYQKKVNEIKDNINRITDLIDHLNRLVKYKSEKEEQLNIIDVIKSAYQLFREQLENRNIKWIEEFSSECVMIEGNFTKVEQVFINLIANARDAMESTLIPRIRIQVTESNKKVNIHFSDNGVGIPKEIQKNIFHSLFTTKKQGTGIGLWLCSTIVEQMNGTIRFTTSQKAGTNFTIVLNKI